MHSFAPTLSFLFSLIFLLPLQFQPAALARAAELAPANANNITARDTNYRRHSSRRRNHAEVGYARNARSDILYPGRRAANAQFTYFKTGLGACGGFNVPSDFIVALNMQEFDVDSHCGAAITITINGKIAHATIVDRCSNCGFNNLDLTTGLYAFFDPTMEGMLHGEWEFGNGAPVVPTTTPTPTHTPKPIPTSTKTSTRPTSTTLKTTSATTSTSASTTTTSSVVTTTTAAAPVQSEVPGNIEQAFLAFLGIGGIVIESLESSS